MNLRFLNILMLDELNEHSHQIILNHYEHLKVLLFTKTQQKVLSPDFFLIKTEQKYNKNNIVWCVKAIKFLDLGSFIP